MSDLARRLVKTERWRWQNRGNGKTHRPLAERFSAKTEPEPMSGCLLWLGTRTVDGYGMIRVNGKMTPAHRVAYELAHGPIPTGLHALHKCDLPPCVEERHVWLGTNADNQRDRQRKGRTVLPAPRASVHGPDGRFIA